MTPYQMVKGKNPTVKFFHVFGCKYFFLKTHPEQLRKFEVKKVTFSSNTKRESTQTVRHPRTRPQTVVEAKNTSVSKSKKTEKGKKKEEAGLTLVTANLNE